MYSLVKLIKQEAVVVSWVHTNTEMDSMTCGNILTTMFVRARGNGMSLIVNIQLYQFSSEPVRIVVVIS